MSTGQEEVKGSEGDIREEPVTPIERESSAPKAARDAGHWAAHTPKLKVSDIAEGARNINVEGRSAVGPLQGFGPMWQKTYRTTLKPTLSPAEVIQVWKENFANFWPSGNRFYAPLAGVKPGEVAVINSSLPGGMPLSTGVMVMYADDESFTLMTTQGHPFSGWVTFSAHESESGTVAQAQVLMRSNDPLYEVGMRLGGHKQEDQIWKGTLTNLASHLGVQSPQLEMDVVCVDPKMQWSRYKNIWHNAGVRSTMYLMTTPVRRIRGTVAKRRS